MKISPLILVHVFGAVIGLLAGALSMILRKGTDWHRVAGQIFTVSMVAMTTSAVYVALFERPNIVNVIAGTLTFYLVITGWMAGRRREMKVSPFDAGALIFGVIATVTAMSSGVAAANAPKGTLDGFPAPGFFIFGTVALLFTIGDVRLLVRGGIAGTKRLARHLWRVGVAYLITLLSFFPGQARLFPPEWRKSILPYLPVILFVIAMIYWIVRVRRLNRRRAALRPELRAAVGVSATLPP
jgi:uncharacterized membrane protein